VQAGVAHAVGVPQSASTTQPWQLPAPLHTRPAPQLVSGESGTWVGCPIAQPAMMQGLALAGTLVSSETLMVPPLPLHTTFWQVPATCPLGAPCPEGT
jgi:hypothetical protein